MLFVNGIGEGAFSKQFKRLTILTNYENFTRTNYEINKSALLHIKKCKYIADWSQCIMGLYII